MKKNKKIASFFKLFCLLLCVLLISSSTTFLKEPPKKLNVLFFLVDDLGWADMGFNGSTFYETPNLNALAKESVQFNRGYAACPVCSPSRAAILTGKNPVRTGITDWINQIPTKWDRNTRLLPADNVLQLDLKENTLAEMLKKAGYNTFFSGKWHLGDVGFLPTDQGFDINKGGFHKGSPSNYFAPYNNPYLSEDPNDTYLPERLSNETSQFIASAPKDKPFFAYHSFYLVHTPLQAKQDLITKYQRKRISWGLKDEMVYMSYDVYHKEKERTVRSVQSHVIYAAMMEALDAAVGKIINTLKKEGLYDNTMIIFTSDNGGLSTSEGKPTSNFPLRGGKGWLYEGGIRVPYLIRLPNNPKNGSQTDAVAWGCDFYPTIAEAVGAKFPKNQVLDGKSLMPILNGKTQKPRTLFWHYPHYGNQGGGPASCIMQGDWKLIYWYDSEKYELFNIKNDNAEKQDLSKIELKNFNALKSELDNWLKNSSVKMPLPNPDFKD